MKTLREDFLCELARMHDSEQRLATFFGDPSKCLSPRFEDIFAAEHARTQCHLKMLEAIFATLGRAPDTKTCETTVEFLMECGELLAEAGELAQMENGFLCLLQKITAFEVASYASLHECALALKYSQSAPLLKALTEDALDSEKRLSEATQKLSVSAHKTTHTAKSVLHSDGENPVKKTGFLPRGLLFPTNLARFLAKAGPRSHV